ncbi:MAG: glycosyltransferase [Planctomycetaceae bacterium]
MNETKIATDSEAIEPQLGVTGAPLLSFVIPALNEERNIARTLEQFAQIGTDVSYEVIVADGGSTDKTVEISRQLGANVYIDTAVHKTIASGRNLGASHARGEILVFCDADTQLKEISCFATRVVEVFHDQRIVGSVPRLEVFPHERIWSDRVFSTFLNTTIRILFWLGWPFAGGQCQVVRKVSFETVHGYNAEQVHGEDSALFKSLSKIGRLRFLSDQTVLESPRRYRKLGYLRLIAIAVYSFIGQSLFRRNVLQRWERID